MGPGVGDLVGSGKAFDMRLRKGNPLVKAAQLRSRVTNCLCLPRSVPV